MARWRWWSGWVRRWLGNRAPGGPWGEVLARVHASLTDAAASMREAAGLDAGVTARMRRLNRG